MRSYYRQHAARPSKVLGRGKAEEVFEGGREMMKLWGKGGMVAGAFRKLVIEEVHLTAPEVSQGLGMLLGVMAEGGIWSFHY